MPGLFQYLAAGALQGTGEGVVARSEALRKERLAETQFGQQKELRGLEHGYRLEEQAQQQDYGREIRDANSKDELERLDRRIDADQKRLDREIAAADRRQDKGLKADLERQRERLSADREMLSQRIASTEREGAADRAVRREEGAADRATRERLQTGEQQFRAGEGAADRKQQTGLLSKRLEFEGAEGQRQREFQAGESALARKESGNEPVTLGPNTGLYSKQGGAPLAVGPRTGTAAADPAQEAVQKAIEQSSKNSDGPPDYVDVERQVQAQGYQVPDGLRRLAEQQRMLEKPITEAEREEAERQLEDEGKGGYLSGPEEKDIKARVRQMRLQGVTSAAPEQRQAEGDQGLLSRKSQAASQFTGQGTLGQLGVEQQRQAGPLSGPLTGGTAGPEPAGVNVERALSEARDAIARGAPRAAVIKRLRELGIDPSGL